MQTVEKSNNIYKQTSIGEIPKDWELVTLKEIIASFKNGIYKEPEYYGRGFPSIRMFNIRSGRIDSIGSPLLEVTPKELEDYRLKAGDIVINRVNSMELVGKAGIVNDDLGDVTFESKNIRIRVNTKRINPYFLAYILSSRIYYDQIGSFTKAAVGQATINQEDLSSIKVPLPSIPRQQKIVSIISKVDELIEKTDQIIEQTQRLKKGLMQKLLTKGIRHKEFKKSQIGIMPAQWNVMQLKEVCTKIIDMDHKMPMKTEEGIPFISVGYLNKSSTIYFDIDKADQELEFISHEDFLSYSKRFNAEHNDLLISRYGTIGVVKIINTDQKFLASYSIALIKPNRDAMIPLFLAYFLNSSVVRKQVIYMTQTSSNTNLGVLDINRIIIFVPILTEQIRISSVLSNVDLYMQQQYIHKRKLKELKRGLMQNLLTGKIRIKI